MKLNLFDFKRKQKESLKHKRQTSILMYEQDFNDIVLLMQELPQESFSAIIREVIHTGLHTHTKLAPKLREIKQKIDDKTQQERLRLNKIDDDYNSSNK